MMTEQQKYIITEEQLQEATDGSCNISKMKLRDEIRSCPYNPTIDGEKETRVYLFLCIALGLFALGNVLFWLKHEGVL